ncbi:MAG: hypothetical protein ACK5XN_09430, partial [Bacteroidota bacterium]
YGAHVILDIFGILMQYTIIQRRMAMRLCLNAMRLCLGRPQHHVCYTDQSPLISLGALWPPLHGSGTSLV